MIVTLADPAARADLRRPLEHRGAEIIATDGTIGSGLRALGQRGLTSLLLEGGAALHQAAWVEQVVDYVRVYATPQSLGPQGVRFLNGSRFSTNDLVERRVERLGPDVMTEGYVHGPR
jgi:riboflavin biosynthesis pyrimidine reductase